MNDWFAALDLGGVSIGAAAATRAGRPLEESVVDASASNRSQLGNYAGVRGAAVPAIQTFDAA